MSFTLYHSQIAVWAIQWLATWTVPWNGLDWTGTCAYILTSKPDGTIVHSLRVFRFSQRCSSVSDSTFRRNVSPSSGPCALDRRRLVLLRRREPISERHVQQIGIIYSSSLLQGLCVRRTKFKSRQATPCARPLLYANGVSWRMCPAPPPSPHPRLAHFHCWPRMIDHVGKWRWRVSSDPNTLSSPHGYCQQWRARHRLTS